MDTDVFTDYSDFVAKPCDLGLVSKRVLQDFYGNDEEGFIADVHLVFENCRAYRCVLPLPHSLTHSLTCALTPLNPQTTCTIHSPEEDEPIHQCANALQARFDDFMGVDA